MNGPNSWEVDSYQEGKWRISVRHNLENDRLDEGDFPEGFLLNKEALTTPSDDKQYHVFMNDCLVVNANLILDHPVVHRS